MQQNDRSHIYSFSGDYRWLSNFAGAQVTFLSMEFKTVEHAYQAAKCINPDDMVMIQSARTPGDAKRLGQRVRMQPDWYECRVAIMLGLLQQKFAPGSDYATKLIATGNAEIIEGNTWGDTFWGKCGNVGQNHLGKLLMQIRDELRR